MNRSVKALISRSALLLALLGSGFVSATESDCQNAEVIGAKLITDTCWSCLFPIRVMGADISGSGQRPPQGANNGMLCSCQDNLGVPRPGISMGMWEPARLVEFQRKPGCSSVLNGITFPFDRMFQGHHGDGEFDATDDSFMHYHYYAFPLLIMMDLFLSRTCNADGYSDLDVMYMSELDPTWSNDELAFFTNPEAAAVANPIAIAACAVDAVSSTAGSPLRDKFWCAGAWGHIYPFSGNQSGGNGVIRDTSLLTARVLSALHRRGLAWKTMGDDAMCRGVISPVLPKTQYKFTILHPVPETSSAHVMGESTVRWGMGRIIPGIGEDPIYTVWRWNDCCNTK